MGTFQNMFTNLSATRLIPRLFFSVGGSYQQSRSLGAHGLQMTEQRNSMHSRRAVQALRNNIWTGNATTLESFVYDVYALDFGEEGAGLHGRLVEDQSTMVTNAVNFLAEMCKFRSVTIVAHSIGGYATILALAENPALQSVVRSVVTLATPHANPILAVEPSLHRVHARIRQAIMPNVALVSISGGLRDEMIPPEACHAANALNLAATDIMLSGEKSSSPLLGMDHRAIVWCHNLLVPVRQILFALHDSENKNKEERLREVSTRIGLSDTYNYLDSINNIRSTYVVRYAKIFLQVSLVLSLM